MHEVSSVYWAIHPIYYFVRIFGLAPYTVEGARWRVSKLSLLYNVFSQVVILLSLIPLFQHILKTLPTGKQDKLAMYTDFSRRVSLALICMICVTLSLVNRHETCKLMEELNEFDLELTSRGMKLDHGERRRENMAVMVVICVLLSVSGAFDSAMEILSENAFSYRIASIFLFFVCYSTQVQFMGFVMELQRRFAVLNNYIISLKDYTLKKHPDTSIVMLCSSVKSNINYASETKYKLNPVSFVCDFHDKLCEWRQSLNSLYSLQILLCTGISCVVVVTYFYVFYLMLSSNEKYEFSTIVFLRLLIWTSWFFSIIFGTSYICANTKDEANKISALLHRIEYDKKDEETKTYIEMFFLQMQHQQVDFSAGGFFFVDLCSLRAIMAAITTYLVLFIQFEMAARSKRTHTSLQ